MSKNRWLALALVLLLCANLRVQYLVTVDGVRLPGAYSAAALREGREAAEAAAEELLRCEAPSPRFERRLRLSFRAAENDVQALTDALLLGTAGITAADAIYLNGVRLGTVPDGEGFCESLREAMLRAMPAAAASGNISGQLEMRAVYTRADSNTPDEDMLRLITGLAPVVYLDANGKLV